MAVDDGVRVLRAALTSSSAVRRLGRRLALAITAYFVLFIRVGRPENWYRDWMTAPLLPIGVCG